MSHNARLYSNCKLPCDEETESDIPYLDVEYDESEESDQEWDPEYDSEEED